MRAPDTGLMAAGRTWRAAALLAALLLAAGGAVGCRRGGPGETGLAPLRAIGERGLRPGQFVKPRSVAAAPDGTIYAVDMTGRVQHLGGDGAWIGGWPMPDVELGQPKGMVCDAAGDLWICEPHYSRVNRYHADGALAEQWGGPGPEVGGADRLNFPRDVAVDDAGHVYVCEYGYRDRILKFGAGGALLTSWGEQGEAPGQFRRPEGLAWAGGCLYVADSCNHRIQVFDGEGVLVRLWGESGSEPGRLRFPYDVAVDGAGRVYVAEYGNSRISVFDPAGMFLGTIGRAGADAGCLLNPWSLAVDARDRLYVADTNNHRIQWADLAGLTIARAARGGGA